MRKLILVSTLALLAACGGDGGGGGGGGWVDVSIAGVTPSSLELTGIAGLPAPIMRWTLSFAGDLESLGGRSVYIGVDVPGLAYYDPTFAIDEANRTLTIEVTGSAPVAEPGRHTGAARIFLCWDAGCVKQLGGSPWAVPFTVDVEPGIQFSRPEVTIEVPFGQAPEPQVVAVTLPSNRTSSFIGGSGGQYLQVGGALGATGISITPLLAPAGSYTGSGTVEVAVPDPSSTWATAQLRATLPITYRVLPDPARPVVISPASRRFDLEITGPYGAHTASDTLTMLQQVLGGWMEIVEARHLSAPAGAAGRPLATSWLTFSNAYQVAFQAAACTGSAAPVCLPPGDYQGALVVRYHAAGGATSDLEVPVQMVIAPTCDGVPKDFQRDTANCGACFDACGPGYACTAGTCECGSGRSVCGAGCYDLSSDEAHCGTCTTICGGALACTAGSCCPGGLSDCGGACVDRSTDQANCGTCGNRCADVYACFDGACGCGPGKMLCPYTCIDVTADVRNCGGCGVTCNADQTCQGGQCTCPAGLTGCGGQYGACVPLDADPANCGACGVACGVGEVCSNGSCGCQPGSARCGGGCVDLASDAWHCGACDAACPVGQTCTAGGCAEDVSAARMLGVDAAHAGVNGGEAGVPPATLAWSAVANGCGGGPAVVEGGRVILFSWRAMHGHSVTTGAELWRREMPTALTTSCPALLDGVAYLDWTDWTGTIRVGRVDAVDVGDGRVLDSAVTSASVSTLQYYLSPLVVGDALFHGGGADGGLQGHGLGPVFTERFAYPQAAPDGWAPGWAAGAVHTSLAGTLRAHDPVTGAVTASRDLVAPGTPWTESGTPVFGAALGYVVTKLQYNSRLDAFTPGTLEAAWSATSYFKHWPAVAGDELYLVNSPTGSPGNGQLQARDALTGAVRWTFDGDGRLQFPPVVAAGHLYVASEANVYAIDLATHQQVWTAPTGGYLTVAEGMLLVNQPFAARLHGYRLSR